MATQTQVLAALMAKLEAQDAAIFALAGLVQPPTTNGIASHTIPTTGSLASGAATVAEGTLARVAASGKGVQLDGSDSWLNTAKDVPALFTGMAVGTRVRMHLNDKGRIIAVDVAAAPAKSKPAPAKAVATVAAPPAPAPAVQSAAPALAPIARGPRGEKLPLQVARNDGSGKYQCALCDGPVHGKDAAEVVARNCAMRQYATLHGETVTVLDPASYARFAAWLGATSVIVGAYTDTGRARIGGTVKPPTDPTPPVTPAPTRGRKAPAGKSASKAATTPPAAPAKVTRAFATDEQLTATTEQMVAGSKPAATSTAYAPGNRAGTYKGILVQHSSKIAGLVKLVSTDLPDCKVVGDWLQAKLPQVVAAVVKTEPNDRVEFTLQGAGADEQIISWKIVSTIAKDAGKMRGVETSGKQQPAAPKRQATDPKVKAARQEARKAATTTAAPAVNEADSDDIDARLRASTARKAGKRAAVQPTPEVSLSEKDAGWQAVTLADGSIKGVGKRKRPSKGQPAVANCSGTTTHRVTCKGAC